ncbi:MAG: four helix bundle protein [Vicinamibacteria bacterium]
MAIPDTGTAPRTLAAGLDRFDCYRVAVAFHSVAAGLLGRGSGALRDQLDRASASAVLNLAEGLGRRAPRDKAHFYAVARGSALESSAIIALAAAREIGEPARCEQAQQALARLVRMLDALERKMKACAAGVSR